jgi:hypothetical protein
VGATALDPPYSFVRDTEKAPTLESPRRDVRMGGTRAEFFPCPYQRKVSSDLIIVRENRPACWLKVVAC